MSKLFGKKSKQQAVCLMAETNSVEDESLEAGTLHAESPDTAEAWLIYGNQQCKDEVSGNSVQFVSSTHCGPIKIYEEIPNLNDFNLSLIASNYQDQALTYAEQERTSKNGGVLWLGICLAILCLTIMIIVLSVVF